MARTVLRVVAVPREWLAKRGALAPLLGGGFWLIAGGIASRACTLLAQVTIARQLGKAAFGSWALVVNTVAFFSLCAASGLGIAATKHIAELREKDPARAGRIVSLILGVASGASLAAGLLCMVFAPWLARVLYETPDLAGPMSVAGLVVCSTIAARVVEGALAGFEAFRRIAANAGVQGLVLLALVVPLSKPLGLSGAVLAVGGSQILALALGVQAMLRCCRSHGISLHWRAAWDERSVLTRFAFPSAIADLISPAAVAMAQAAVARLPGGVVALGGYQAASNWRDIVLFVPTTLGRVTLPTLARLRGLRRDGAYSAALRVSVLINSGLAAGGTVVVLLASPWLLGLYGPGFAHELPGFAIVVGTTVVQSARDVMMQTTASLGKMWWNGAASAVWGTILVGGTLAVAPLWGVLGYAWVRAGATVVSLCVYALAARGLLRRA